MKKWISTAQSPLLVWSTIRKTVPTTGHDSGEFGNSNIVSGLSKVAGLLASITVYFMILAGYSARLFVWFFRSRCQNYPPTPVIKLPSPKVCDNPDYPTLRMSLCHSQ